MDILSVRELEWLRLKKWNRRLGLTENGRRIKMTKHAAYWFAKRHSLKYKNKGLTKPK